MRKEVARWVTEGARGGCGAGESGCVRRNVIAGTMMDCFACCALRFLPVVPLRGSFIAFLRMPLSLFLLRPGSIDGMVSRVAKSRRVSSVTHSGVALRAFHVRAVPDVRSALVSPVLVDRSAIESKVHLLANDTAACVVLASCHSFLFFFLSRDSNSDKGTSPRDWTVFTRRVVILFH